MKLSTHSRAAQPLHRARGMVFPLLLLVALGRPAGAQQPGPSPSPGPAPLSTEQVVHSLVGMNLLRAGRLHSYQGTRVYRAEYRGIGGSRQAEMIVEVKYLSPGTKEFTIRSEAGSALILNRVFKKLLLGEQEALEAETLRRTALNEENYRFTLLGHEPASSGWAYVLSVEPKRKDKFLYSGKIWVDAEDFAVVRIEAVPAKNPSFWTKKAEILQVYEKVDDFWLPAYNRSETAIRLGGHAKLTIEYNDYQVRGPDPAATSSTLEADPAARIRGTQRSPDQR